MSVQEFNRFRCRQSELQTQGGFCCGLSVALVSHILDCADGADTSLTPRQVFDYAEEYLSAVRASGNILDNTVPPGFQDFRQRIFHLQSQYSRCILPEKPFVRGCGLVLLVLSVGEINKRRDNCAYLKRSTYPMNHMGIAFYGTGDEIFIFDPNTGGMIIRWNEDVFTPTVIHAVDNGLQKMYKMYDRLQGTRTANVVLTGMLSEHHMPYGDLL
ncbi:hypothetical protein AB6869_22250 [Rahnella rivi]|uniref:hypothetical protein n=1 Tax=Rahnella rivi TaxID=2816249 RepID=UPI0010A4242B|nr:hypothetical protein [Rahnella rivi]MBU9831746.1 hypothetical protein [Rahnella rivi]THD42998.1 hypothetical protein ERD95_21555 [Enterobacteriaceae bacterium ML5]